MLGDGYHLVLGNYPLPLNNSILQVSFPFIYPYLIVAPASRMKIYQNNKLERKKLV
jgi:hypothetical protein